MQERIQKILARAGIASRRNCEELIKKRRVTVNGKTAEIGQKADAEKDDIRVDGMRVKFERLSYYMINKPKGYITSTKPKEGRPITDLLKVKERVYPVGRLDRDTEGLVILTNDGELANKIMHPRYEVKKTYYLETDKPLQFKDVEAIRKGIRIDGRVAKPEMVEWIGGNKARIVLHEGRKHIVKKIFKARGYYVKKLVRTKVADLELERLKPGEYRELRKEEIERLKKSTNTTNV